MGLSVAPSALGIEGWNGNHALTGAASTLRLFEA